MTREDAINNYIIPACERMWNEKICKKIIKVLKNEYNAPMRGKWLQVEGKNMECSKCHRYFPVKMLKSMYNIDFCPQCGSDNREVSE